MKANYKLRLKKSSDLINEIFFYDKPFKHCTRVMPSVKKREIKTSNVLIDTTQINFKFWWQFKSKPNKKQRMKIPTSLWSLPLSILLTRLDDDALVSFIFISHLWTYKYYDHVYLYHCLSQSLTHIRCLINVNSLNKWIQLIKSWIKDCQIEAAKGRDRRKSTE